MKTIIKIIILLILGFGATAQTPETIALGNPYEEITVIGNTLYRGGQGAQVATYDLGTSNFTEDIIGTGPGTNPHLRFAVNPTEENVYISEFGGPIYAAAITESNLTLIQQGATTGGEVLGMAISGNTVYYNTTAPQILRFQMNDPDSTQEVFFDPASILPIFNMIIANDVLYYSTQSDFEEPIDYQLFSLDITATDPTPQLVTTAPERAWTFVVEGDVLYIGSDQNNSVYTKDLSDSSAQEATLLRTLDLGNATNLYSIDAAGDFFYYSSTGQEGGIYRIALDNLSVSNSTKTTPTVFPNPVESHLQLSGINAVTPYEIYSLDGKKVVSGDYLPNTSIDLEDLASGIYVLSLNGVRHIKVFKQ